MNKTNYINLNEANKPQRYYVLDYTRLITAYLVVFAHLLPECELRNYIYQFHMPLFFIISGMLTKTMSNRECIIKNIKTILIPFISFIIIPTLIKLPFIGLENSIGTIKASIKGIVFSSDIPSNYVLWFLIVLFNLKLIINIFKNVKCHYCLIFYLISFLISHKYNFFFYEQTMMSLPFFVFGYKHKSNILSLTKTKMFYSFGFITFILTYIILQMNGRVSINKTIYGSAHIPFNYLLFYINAIIGTLSIFYVGSLLSKYIKSTYIANISGALITIMCAQFMFIDFFNYYIEIFSYDIQIKIIISIVITICCILLHQMLNKYIPFIFGKF